MWFNKGPRISFWCENLIPRVIGFQQQAESHVDFFKPEIHKTVKYSGGPLKFLTRFELNKQNVTARAQLKMKDSFLTLTLSIQGLLYQSLFPFYILVCVCILSVASAFNPLTSLDREAVNPRNQRMDISQMIKACYKGHKVRLK